MGMKSKVKRLSGCVRVIKQMANGKAEETLQDRMAGL